MPPVARPGTVKETPTALSAVFILPTRLVLIHDFAELMGPWIAVVRPDHAFEMPATAFPKKSHTWFTPVLRFVK